MKKYFRQKNFSHNITNIVISSIIDNIMPLVYKGEYTIGNLMPVV